MIYLFTAVILTTIITTIKSKENTNDKIFFFLSNLIIQITILIFNYYFKNIKVILMLILLIYFLNLINIRKKLNKINFLLLIEYFILFLYLYLKIIFP